MEFNASTKTVHRCGESHIVWNPDGYSSLTIILIIIGTIMFFGSILMILFRMTCPNEPIFFGMTFRRLQKENNKKSIPLERESNEQR